MATEGAMFTAGCMLHLPSSAAVLLACWLAIPDYVRYTLDVSVGEFFYKGLVGMMSFLVALIVGSDGECLIIIDTARSGPARATQSLWSNQTKLVGDAEPGRPLHQIVPVERLGALHGDHRGDVPQVLLRAPFSKELELLQNHILGRGKWLDATVGQLDPTDTGETRSIEVASCRDDDVRLETRGHMDDVEHAPRAGGLRRGLNAHVPIVTLKRRRKQSRLTLVHAHHDVDVVRETRLAEHHRGQRARREAFAAKSIEPLPNEAEKFGRFHQPRDSAWPWRAIRRAVSAHTAASDQLGCCAFTPLRTNATADRHMASSVASFAAGDCDRSTAIMAGSQRSSVGWDVADCVRIRSCINLATSDGGVSGTGGISLHPASSPRGPWFMCPCPYFTKANAVSRWPS